MRIRLPFAAAFFLILLGAAYLGLTPLQLPPYVNDKALHLVTFFLLTLTIYWVPDTTRRRTLHLTLTVSLILSLSSEILRAILPNGRDFDVYNVAANIVGSIGAIGICGWYHKRMLERRRRAKGYVMVGDGAADAEEGEEIIARRENGEVDLELGDRSVGAGQQSGIVDSGITAPRTTTLDDEIDNWDEHAGDDWDDEHTADTSGDGEGPKTPSASSTGELDGSDVK